MSPELQRREFVRCGRRVDSWSFGCLTLELFSCTGPTPEWGELADKDQGHVDGLVAARLPTGCHVNETIKHVLDSTLIW